MVQQGISNRSNGIAMYGLVIGFNGNLRRFYRKLYGKIVGQVWEYHGKISQFNQHCDWTKAMEFSRDFFRFPGDSFSGISSQCRSPKASKQTSKEASKQASQPASKRAMLLFRPHRVVLQPIFYMFTRCMSCMPKSIDTMEKSIETMDNSMKTMGTWWTLWINQWTPWKNRLKP